MHLVGHSILVSTVGLLQGLQALPMPLPFQLAVSLHATDDSTRNWLVPMNRKYPISALLGSLQNRFPVGSTDMVMIEYLLLKGVNDSEAEA